MPEQRKTQTDGDVQAIARKYLEKYPDPPKVFPAAKVTIDPASSPKLADCLVDGMNLLVKHEVQGALANELASGLRVLQRLQEALEQEKAEAAASKQEFADYKALAEKHAPFLPSRIKKHEGNGKEQPNV